MKGNEKILESLNELLADELTAINQYMVQSEMCADWGYQKLHEAIEKRAIEEMKHAEKLIGRILFLEGKPVVQRFKVDFRDEPLPLSGAGKILKKDLRAPYWQGHDRNVS